MKTQVTRLKKIKARVGPPERVKFDIVWIDIENDTYTINGVTMNRAEYEEYKRRNPGPVIDYPEGGDGDAPGEYLTPRRVDYRDALKGHPIPPGCESQE